MVVTESLENYLRVIYEVQLESDVVRIKDIIKRLKVSTPSAVQAIKKLADKGLVTHEKRSYVKLTQKGIIQAEKVYQNHKMLFRFFKEVLGIAVGEAETLSCVMEHHLTQESFGKFKALVEYFLKKPQVFKDFQNFLKEGKRMRTTLDSVAVGDAVKVLGIEGSSPLKSRLLSMGILPGVTVKLERIAPLGDPIEVIVKGFRLSLRKEEAKAIIVEKE